MKIEIEVPDHVAAMLNGEGKFKWNVLAVRLAPLVNKRTGFTQGLNPRAWREMLTIKPVKSWKIVPEKTDE